MRLLCLALLCAGCFSPDFKPGFPCSPEGGCPADMQCRVGACWLPKTDAECAGAAAISGSARLCPSGEVVLTASPGEARRWSTGATTPSITVTASGSYKVAVDGCESDAFVVTDVPVLPPPVITPSARNLCPGVRDSITLTSEERSSYRWSDGSTEQSLVVSAPGTYSVTTDDGCYTTTFDVVEASVPTITQGCSGRDILLVAPEGATYLWSTGVTTQNAFIPGEGSYTVITDDCKTSEPFIVTAEMLRASPQTFNYTGGVQTFVVPACVSQITIDAYGAQGGGEDNAGTADGGLGARARGDFAVTQNEPLSVVVGGQGGFGTCFAGGGGESNGGGGGGTFVWRATDVTLPLIAAGGGGGSGGLVTATYDACPDRTGRDGMPASSTGPGSDGNYAYAAARGLGRSNGLGGTGGASNSASSAAGAGGGGWLEAGGAAVSSSVTLGGHAGAGGGGDFAGGTTTVGATGASGGFGGGGASYCGGGGGGGFSGGGGAEGTYSQQAFGDAVKYDYLYCGGGGGGSFNQGASPLNQGGQRPGNGLVTISW